MRNPLTLLQRFSQPQIRMGILSSVVGLAVWCAIGLHSTLALAATPDTAPPELKEILSEIDAAANRQDVKAVMQFYSSSLSHADGLTTETMQKGLVELWKRYPKLNYRTELVSWQVEGQGIVAETVTYITGVEQLTDREMALTATMRSRQRYESKKIVRQEILAETSQLTTGKNPPKIDVKLPDRIRSGEEFSFDAIVLEPLGNNLLIGSALEEPIQADSYLTPPLVKLEALPAGGIFKVGKAAAGQNGSWISAIVVRQDGITMITKRMQIVGSER